MVMQQNSTLSTCRDANGSGLERNQAGSRSRSRSGSDSEPIGWFLFLKTSILKVSKSDLIIVSARGVQIFGPNRKSIRTIRDGSDWFGLVFLVHQFGDGLDFHKIDRIGSVTALGLG